MQRYDEETIVVKYGGHAMGNEEVARAFARDIVLLEQTAINPVVVHGGGPQIEAMLKQAGVQSQFAGGLRITDAKTLEIVEMVLAGSINKSDRRLHQRRRRQGDRPVRQGRQHGDRQEGDPPRRRSGFQHREGGRSRLRRRAGQGRHHRARHRARPRADPGAGAGVRRRPTAAASTSTPTRSPARSPARSRPSAFCCSPTCRACSTRTRS